MKRGCVQPERQSLAEKSEVQPLVDFLKEQRDKSIQRLLVRVMNWRLKEMDAAFQRLVVIVRLYHTVDRCRLRPATTPTYLVDAAFLEEAFRQLSRGRNEAISYVTGPEGAGETFVLSRLLPLRLSHSSLARARANLRDQIETLTRLEQAGHRLLAYFHRHPGSGPRATVPSLTDLRTQRNLEQGGYAAIGGIFSQDGYIRFFAHERQFRVLVTGKNVIPVENQLFHLELGRGIDRGDQL